MMTRYDYVLGIDPDCDRSGVALLRPSGREFELLTTMGFTELLEELQSLKARSAAEGFSLKVVIEASWRVKTNWHVQSGKSKAACGEIGHRVGRNHEAGIKIAEICRWLGLAVEEKLPLKKIWHTRDGKISHRELVCFTKISRGRTNPEERDAALLAWDYAGLPMFMKL